MTNIRSWLPAEAIQRGVRGVPMRASIRDWASSWFAAGQAAVGQADVTGDPVATTEPGKARGTCWQLADGVVLALATDAEARIAAAMFGAPDDPALLTAADRAALDATAEACIADLRVRLASALRLSGDAWRGGAPDDGLSAPWWSWRVSDGRGSTLLEIGLSEELIVRRVRAMLAPVPDPRDLSSFAAALSDQVVAVSALVGRSRLTTTELAGLARGDVLVLDRDLDKPANIAIEHRPKSLFCTVDRDDDRLQLTIV